MPAMFLYRTEIMYNLQNLPRFCSWNNFPSSKGRVLSWLLWSRSSRSSVRSPNSAGMLRSLLEDTSRQLRWISWQTSGGSSTRWLSFRKREVICWKWNSWGQMLRTDPVNNKQYTSISYSHCYALQDYTCLVTNIKWKHIKQPKWCYGNPYYFSSNNNVVISIHMHKIRKI